MAIKRLQLLSRVISNVEIIPNHKVITVLCPEVANQALPGHFLNVLVADVTDPLLRKPFSIYKVDTNSGELSLLYSIVGETTLGMSRKRPGDMLDLFGPLGGVLFDSSAAKNGRHIMVGGGYGVPPLIFLAKTIRDRSVDEKIEFILGAKSRLLVVGDQDVRDLGLSPLISTEDGTLGVLGRVTDLLHPLLNLPNQPQTTVYCCGSTGMMRAVADLCGGYPVHCQISLETAMPCGVGVCMGCVVDMADGRRVRSCVEGPVFEAEEVKW